MTKAEEALYHILCARWKITEGNLSDDELLNLFGQAVELVDRLSKIRCNRKTVELREGATGMVVQ